MLDSKEFWTRANLPFTRLRAQQYISNPSAAEEDPLWLIVWHEAQIIAYLGMIPDRVDTSAEILKVCWLTSIWVDPAWRNKGLAAEMFKQALRLYPHSCVNSGTPQAQSLLLKLNLLQVYGSRARTWFIFTPNKAILRNFQIRNPLILAALPVLKCLSSIYSRQRMRSWKKRYSNQSMSVEYLSEPDQESLDFLQAEWQNELSYKDRDSFIWRTHNHVNDSKLAGVKPVYTSYFGNLGFAQQNINLKLVQNGEIVGYANLLITDGILKLPFFYLRETVEEGFIALLADLILHNSIDAIYTQHPHLNKLLQSHRIPVLLRKSYPMRILLSPQLMQIEKGKIVQDGDGAF